MMQVEARPVGQEEAVVTVSGPLVRAVGAADKPAELLVDMKPPYTEGFIQALERSAEFRVDGGAWRRATPYVGYDPLRGWVLRITYELEA